MKGRIPGVLYGGEQPPVSLTLNARDFEFLLQAQKRIAELKAELTPGGVPRG